MSGANSTPLGKGHPAIGAVKKAPVNLGGSLLKPSYMSNAGSNGSVNSGASLFGPPAIQACSIGAAAAAAAKAAAALAINKRDRDPSPGRRGRDDERKRKRKSRWQGDEKEKIFIPGMPTVLPPNLSKDQEEAYLLQLQIEEISRRLRSNDLGIPANPDDRSPSPEPVYNNEGKRLNTRDYRTRKKLEDDRHSAITRMFDLNKDYKPPSDYKPPVVKVSDKVMIPQEEHPDINFVGLLIGPRGNTLKSMEKDTGAKIIIRGKGSVKEGKVGRKDGPMPGEDEPLHAFVSGTNIESVKKAVDKIKEIIRQGVEVPEGQNDLRRMQLRELALLNGTLRESDGPRCSNCGMNTHKSWQCPEKPNLTQGVICTACGGAGHIAKDCRQPKPGQAAANAGSNHMPLGGGTVDRHKIDQEYMSLMAELGEGPPPPSSGGSSSHTPSTGNIRSLFDRPQSAPRPLLSLGPPPLSMLPRTTAPMTSNSSTTSINPWASPPNSALNSGPGLLSNPPVSLGGGTAGQRGLLGPAPGTGFSGAPNSSQTPRPLMPPSSNNAPNLAQPPPGVLGSHAAASAPPPPWQQTQQQQLGSNSLQQQLQQQSSAQQQNTSAPPPLLQAPPPPPPPSSQQQNHHHQQQQQQGPPAWMNQAPPGPPGGNMGGPNMGGPNMGGPPQMNPWQHQPHQGGPPPPPGMQQQHGPPGMGCPPPGPVPPPRPVGPPPVWGWNGPQNMGPPPPGMGGGPGGPGGQQRGPNGVDLGALLSAPPPPPPS